MTAPPMAVRLRLIHGVLQRHADRIGADVLHVKGPAVPDLLLEHRVVQDTATGEESTVVVPRNSNDADVLVRREHVRAFLDEVGRHGWVRKTTFDTSSAFGHALNIYHPTLGNADIHRAFPGLGPEGFDELWRLRTKVDMGAVACPVPDLTGQRLVLLLHAARSGASHPDVDRAWGRATEAERAEVVALARRAGADMGLAAALGTLDDHANHPDYLLWKHFGSGNTGRLEEWQARWRSARTLRDKLAVARSFLIFDPALLEARSVARQPCATASPGPGVAGGSWVANSRECSGARDDVAPTPRSRVGALRRHDLRHCRH